MEQYEIGEILLNMEQSGQDKTNPKLFRYYLELWEELQAVKENKIWVNNQPI